MVDQGKEDGTIQEDEKEYINNVFEFNDIVASEIMFFCNYLLFVFTNSKYFRNRICCN